MRFSRFGMGLIVPVRAGLVLLGIIAMTGLTCPLLGEETRKPAMAVLRLEAKGAVDPRESEALDDFLNAQVFATGVYELVNRDDIDAVMKEFKLQGSGICDTTKCYAELGGALGADKLLAGSVAKLGTAYILTLKIIDITEIKEEFVGSDECRCSPEELTDTLRRLVKRVVAKGQPTVQAIDQGLGENSDLPVTSGNLGVSTPPEASQGPEPSTRNPGQEESRRPPRTAEEIIGEDGAPMVLVPEGEYLMGASDLDDDVLDDAKPRHSVYLDAYYIDKHEVTNAHYSSFVAAVRRNRHKTCEASEPVGKDHSSDLSSDREFGTAKHPVVGVDWYDAYAYCAWAGKRLPTEAEWEKAARGTDARMYPWGSARLGAFLQGNFSDETARGLHSGYIMSEGDDIDGPRMPEYSDWYFIDGYTDGYVRTAPVGSFPSGASPYGALDMAGNVWEWVQDWYSDEYYARSPAKNPKGPENGKWRVLRGSSWFEGPWYLRSDYRFNANPERRDDESGFRCAKDS